MQAIQDIRMTWYKFYFFPTKTVLLLHKLNKTSSYDYSEFELY